MSLNFAWYSEEKGVPQIHFCKSDMTQAKTFTQNSGVDSKE